MSSDLQRELIQTWEETVSSLSGERLVDRALVALDPPIDPATCVTLALGKAAASMLAGAEKRLGTLRGTAVLHVAAPTPPGIASHIGDHPIPGPASLAAGEALLSAVEAIDEGETALVLLSGGGSALAEVLEEGASLEEFAEATEALMAAGCSIQELNLMRRSHSRIKGGKLLEVCRAKRIEVLAISDVRGDDPAVIASGPFWPMEAAQEGDPEVRPPGDPRVRTTILAGPMDLREAAVRALRQRGFRAFPWPGFVSQDVDEVAASYLRWLEGAQGERAVLVGVGEPVLRLPSDPGVGGRSQHLALRMAIGMEGKDAAFLAAGSDGRDGPTENAGACVTGETMNLARSQGVDLVGALRQADSATAAIALSVAIPSRPTGTNLTDLHLLARG